MFSCNLPPALLAEWPGSFTCYCGNMGVERIPKLESAQKVNPGEENSPAAPTVIWTRDLMSWVRRSNHWAIPVPNLNLLFIVLLPCSFYLCLFVSTLFWGDGVQLTNIKIQLLTNWVFEPQVRERRWWRGASQHPMDSAAGTTGVWNVARGVWCWLHG